MEYHRNRSGALRTFVQRMPKGGDIHSHFSGAVYAEHYLEWAAEDGYCVDPKAEALVEPQACGQDSHYFPASPLFNRTSVYDTLVNRWSTRNLPFAGRSGHDQFFEAFLMVSLFADAFNDTCPLSHQRFAKHPWWNNQRGWKNLLNNLRLIIQPLICFNWLKR